MAVYLDRDSIALVHDQPQGDEHQVDIILCLDIGQVNTSFRLHVGQTEPDTPRDLAGKQYCDLFKGNSDFLLLSTTQCYTPSLCVPDSLSFNLGCVTNAYALAWRID